jgi:hypothetical protein
VKVFHTPALHTDRSSVQRGAARRDLAALRRLQSSPIVQMLPRMCEDTQMYSVLTCAM